MEGRKNLRNKKTFSHSLALSFLLTLALVLWFYDDLIHIFSMQHHNEKKEENKKDMKWKQKQEIHFLICNKMKIIARSTIEDLCSFFMRHANLKFFIYYVTGTHSGSVG